MPVLRALQLLLDQEEVCHGRGRDGETSALAACLHGPIRPPQRPEATSPPLALLLLAPQICCIFAPCDKGDPEARALHENPMAVRQRQKEEAEADDGLMAKI